MVCGKEFRQIQWSHLKFKHNVTSVEYQEKFPRAPIWSLMSREKLSESLAIINTMKERGSNLVLEPVDDSTVPCRICGRRFSRITASHLKIHSTTTDKYREEFPKAPLASNEYKRNMSESQLKSMPRSLITKNKDRILGLRGDHTALGKSWREVSLEPNR